VPSAACVLVLGAWKKRVLEVTVIGARAEAAPARYRLSVEPTASRWGSARYLARRNGVMGYDGLVGPQVASSDASVSREVATR
jgi:hypothetical protein